MGLNEWNFSAKIQSLSPCMLKNEPRSLVPVVELCVAYRRLLRNTSIAFLNQLCIFYSS